MWRRLKDRLAEWLLPHAIAYGFEHLSRQELGIKLRDALDARFGEDRADTVQKELARWLKEVAEQLDA